MAASAAWVLLLLGLLAACATGHPMGGTLAGSGHSRAMTRPAGSEKKARAVRVLAAAEGPASAQARVSDGAETQSEDAHSRPPHQGRREGAAEEAGATGWRDGVGSGRPYAVPMTLDYFQGFLIQAGIPSTAVPEDGRALSSRQALELLPYLLSTPVTLGNFGPRRMAAHLLLEVATGEVPVSRDELHARMRRFSRLRVLRPDGYLVKPTTGVAVQKAGEVVLADDGALRAGRFEVGPFYAIDGGRLFPVDERLAVPHGARPAGLYEPDDGVLLPVAEGAVLAVVDTVEGLYRLVFHTGETLEGLAQLPGAVRELYEHAPQRWEEFRHKPYAERVRTVSRLATGAVLMVGTSGAGAAKAVSWGGKLGSSAVPLLSLSGDGLLAVRLVAVPVGGAIAVTGNALSATYVLHMANTGAQGAGGGGGWPPVGGPGQWVEDTSSMSEQARAYQAQVTGAPKGWCYKVCRDGKCVDYDGYDPKTGTLLEVKAREYDKWFDADLKPQWGYQGLEGMVAQARRQLRLAGGLRLRWHVAEPRMVAILRKHFEAADLGAIEVVYTPPLP
ncbi:Tox-REase-5 domain-containing protein [Archangium violaceum]|uniref:Tox-REase-5 domain-containing protein n=1 Tax=Archangium violaceum TaxID=83451 RepID=UPI0037BF748C